MLRNLKNRIGNGLPNAIRQRVAATAVTGLAIRAHMDGDKRLSKKAAGEAKKLWAGRGRIPPPGKNNRVHEMLTFKQFLLEMPSLLGVAFPQLSNITPWDKTSRVGRIDGTKTKYELHRADVDKKDNYIRYYAVHPKTKKVHMEVSGMVDNNNNFHVGMLNSVKEREPGMAKHFYSAILNHHNMVSDDAHSEQSHHLYTTKLPYLKGVQFHQVAVKNGKIGPGKPIHPADVPQYYGTKEKFYIRKRRD
jgi:hypothetical protein